MPSGTDYPPERHLGRDLGVAYRLPEAGRIELSAGCSEQIVRADGGVCTEAICSIVDETIGFVAVLAAQPEWGSTAALTLGFTQNPVQPEGRLRVEGRVVKAGRRLVFTECEVRWHDVLVAHARGQFARVGRTGSNTHMDVPEPDPEEVFEMGNPGSRGAVDMTDQAPGRPMDMADQAPGRPMDMADQALSRSIGFTTRGPGAVELEFCEYVSNSSGILHGGVAAALVLAAAEDAAGAPAGSAEVQFLSAGRQGPFLAHAERFEGEGPGVWLAQTTDSATDTLMNRAVVRTG